MALEIIKLVISIGICLLAGFISGLWTSKSISSWYKNLKKPSFNPPNWLFAPVWTFLYILMGISLYLVWTNNGPINAIIIFAVQLLLNFLWSLIFFSMKIILLAFIDIILLWIMIILTILQFYQTSHAAAYLLIPYLLWVSFASVLNFSIYLLNRK